MTFLHPGFLYAAAAAAAAVFALHFLVAEQPRAGILPTVRFFPDVQVRATALTVRLSDLPLLLIRVLTLLLIGAAFAQPRLNRSHSAILRILVVDISRDIGSASEAGDSAAKYASAAASIIAFDSAATEVTPAAIAKGLEPLRSVGGISQRGSISSALIVALRTASRMRARADSMELVLVSPLLAEEADSATPAIRALWPGKIAIVRTRAAPEPIPAARDVKVEWADSSSNTRWSARSAADTIGGVKFEGGVLIYPFVRRWRLARTDSAARVIARWIDGEPAIVEQAAPFGCVRSISVPIPTAGDAVLRPSFARFFESIASPCAPLQNFTPMSPASIAVLAGPSHLAPARELAPEATQMTPLVPWLLAAALALALLELLVRKYGERRNARRDVGAASEATGEYPAAKTA
jgi:hypothetical protein